jgi:hypothetical protein
LKQLETSFQGAAKGGPIPTAQQLQQAGLSVGHHHHGGGHYDSSSSQSSAVNAFQAANTANSQNQTLAASIFSSLTPSQVF